MFGDVAQRLLKIMGHSGTVPGTILAKDVPAALLRLKNGIKSDASDSRTNTADADEDSDKEKVSLAHRALPLIELLTAAAKEKCDVMWEWRILIRSATAS
jgi:hypothetical protein